MTVSAETPILSSTANGVTTVFPYAFTVLQAADLKVKGLLAGVAINYTLGVDYTLTGVGTSSGSVVFGVAPANGIVITRYRDSAVARSTDYQENGDLLSATLDLDFDRIWLSMQEQSIKQGGAIRLPYPEQAAELPQPAARASKVLSFDGAGVPQVVAPVAGTATALAIQLADPTNAANGDKQVATKRTVTGAIATTVHDWIEGQVLNVVTDFGAVPGGVVDCSAAFTSMWATGLPWEIPAGDYLVNSSFTISASGICWGRLIAKTGFTGRLITVCNTVYDKRLSIWGLDVYSTDVRPNPYTAASNTGIYVGPDAANLGVNSCPNVALYSCRSTRFSYGAHIATYNVDCYSCNFFQNDHNGWIYSADTVHNQVNDVHFYGCSMDSAATSVGAVAYALRVGTSGNGTYASSIGMGYNLKFIGCNFDGAPVYVDNVIGIDIRSYFEQPSGYTYHGGAIVLGSAGANTLQDVNISQCTFNLFDYAVVEKNSVLGLSVGPNNCSAIKYRELLAVACESFGFRYISGTSIGSFNANGDPVGTNFSSGIATSQLTFGGISIDRDFLTGGAQLAPTQASSTSWYPRGMTNDGWFDIAAKGRNRTGSAVQSAIAGNQVGQVFTFTTPAQAALFTGGDALNGLGAGGALYVYSVDYVAGTAVLNNTFTGATTLTHDPAYFIGYNLFGNGSPAGVVTANPGSRYVNFAGGAGTTTYVKETGTGTAGWVAK